MQLVLNTGIDSMDNYIWNNFKKFIESYHEFFELLRKRCKTYIQVEFTYQTYILPNKFSESYIIVMCVCLGYRIMLFVMIMKYLQN